ncbi:hypothetical protein ACJX0J_027408, partial [Zea mays]
LQNAARWKPHFCSVYLDQHEQAHALAQPDKSHLLVKWADSLIAGLSSQHSSQEDGGGKE